MTTTIGTEQPAAPAARGPARGSGAKTLVVGLTAALAVLLAGFAVPYVITDAYRMSLVLDGTILGLLAIGIGFLARHLGLISLGHGAFFGSAAYAVGIAVTNWGWAPTTSVGFAVVVGTGISLLMGILVVRASGFGFLMLTLALSQAMYALCVQASARPLTGAFDGKLLTYDREETFLGLTQADVLNPGLFWPIAWVSLVVAATVLWLVGRSRFGVTMEGIRENEERMRFCGYDTFLPRLAAFVLTGAVASVGGALFALNAGYVSPEVLSFSQAGDSLTAVLVGGFGVLGGPILGTFLYVYAQSVFSSAGNLHLFMGAALVVVMVFLPGGITGALGRFWRGLRRLRR